MEGVGDRLTRRSVLVVGAGAVAAAAVYGRIPVAHAAAPPRDPRIIGSWGGFVVPATGCWFGADDTTRGFTAKTGIETELGRRMAIRNRRYGWLATCPSPQAVADAGLTSPRVVVMCSFGQPSTFPCKTSGWSGREDLSATAYGTGGFVQGQRVKVGKTSYDKDGSVTGNSLILDTYQSVMQNPWVVAYLPWNNSGPNGVAFVDTSAKSLAQYKQWANDPYFGLVLT
jgi:hypothetical protein